MEVHNIPADAFPELDEWHAAWSVMARTDEEIEQEAAYWADLARAEDYAEYVEAQAAAAAEEAAAEEAATADFKIDNVNVETASRSRPTRSKRDGLTQDERALLRQPDRYTVKEVAPSHWWAAHQDCQATFAATKVDGRTLLIVSNTGGEYTCRVEADFSVTCPCKHAEKMRERGVPPVCKHSAVTIAVADYCAAAA
jgi:hypothetical protein